jgi:hypothetical protein
LSDLSELNSGRYRIRHSLDAWWDHLKKMSGVTSLIDRNGPSAVVGLRSRRLALDYSLALTFAFYVGASILTGRIYRYPFDDEVGSTLILIAKYHTGGLLKMLFSGFPEDAYNAPLALLVFSLGSSAGLSPSSLRWISVAFTAGSLVIWNQLTIDALEGRLQRPTIKILIAILFGLSPLALGLGDALRYYSLLAFLVSIAYLVYLRAGKLWYLSAIPLGLAADSCPLAIVPFIAIFAERHLLKKRPKLSESIAYVGLAGFFAVPAFMTFVVILRDPRTRFTQEFESNAVVATLKTALGFFGGYTLGVSQSYLVAIYIIALGYFIFDARKLDCSPSRRLWNIAIITLAVSLLVPLCGLAIPRSFVFAAPIVCAAAALGVAYSIDSSPALASAAYGILLLVSFGIAARIQVNYTPFKRNTAIPFSQVCNFVYANTQGDTLVASSDEVAAFSLDGHPGLCVAGFYDGKWWLNENCLNAQRRDTVIVVRNNPDAEHDPNWVSKVARIRQARGLVAKAHFGIDNDASFKSRVSGMELPRDIVSVEVYR